MNSLRGHDGIFVSYRREDTAGQAGRLYDRLGDHFGEDRVFMDVDSIGIGADFTRAIRDAVSGCSVLIVLIGQDWLTFTDGKRKRRLDNPDDWVRVEIETALQRDIRVVPVLVDGAALPQASDLPLSLRPLVERQALVLSHIGFRSEVSHLIAAIEDVVSRKHRFAEAPYGPQELDGVLSHETWHSNIIRVNSVVFSQDGQLLASASKDDIGVRLWDLADRQQLRTLTGHTGSVNSVAFSPDGQLLASGGKDAAVQLWAPATGQQLRTLTGHTGSVNSVAFSPDGQLLATGGDAVDDATVQLWDPATGQQLAILTGDDSVRSVVFSSDGRWLASAGEVMTRLWDAATGQQLRTLSGHTRGVTSLAFNPDGRLLAGAQGTTVQLWDPATGQQLRGLTGHTGSVNSVAFSPDGQLLASAGDDTAVRLWR
jgi:uncharacterized protein with WD repeat